MLIAESPEENKCLSCWSSNTMSDAFIQSYHYQLPRLQSQSGKILRHTYVLLTDSSLMETYSVVDVSINSSVERQKQNSLTFTIALGGSFKISLSLKG